MRKSILFWSLFVLIMIGPPFSTSLKAETVLFCQSKLATGFFNEGGTWRQGRFQEQRFTLKFNDDFTKLKGFISGLDDREMECSKPYKLYPDEIYCVHLMGSHETFLYHSKSKRFIASKITSTGWLVDGTDTDVIHAGTCKTF